MEQNSSKNTVRASLSKCFWHRLQQLDHYREKYCIKSVLKIPYLYNEDGVECTRIYLPQF